MYEFNLFFYRSPFELPSMKSSNVELKESKSRFAFGSLSDHIILCSAFDGKLRFSG